MTSGTDQVVGISDAESSAALGLVQRVCADATRHIDVFFASSPNCTPQDAASTVSAIISAACKSINPSYEYRVIFDHINDFMPNMHRELCIVDINKTICLFTFPKFWFHVNNQNHMAQLAKRVISLSPVLPRRSFFCDNSGFKFVFEIGDNGYMASVAFCSKNNFGCLIPDWDFISSSGYASIAREFELTRVPWADRKAAVFWRGGTTGVRRFDPPDEGKPDDFRWLQRLWLCKVARGSVHRNMCDIAISNIVQIHEEHLVARLRSENLMGDYVQRAEIGKFQGIIDIDGNSNAWSGLFTALLSGACVFKVGSEKDYRQWYYFRLSPFKNYIPISHDFGDFDDAISWLLHSGGAASEVAAAGQALALELTFDKSTTNARDELETWLRESFAVQRTLCA